MTACVTIFTIFVNDFEQLVINESLSDLDVLWICSRSRLNEPNPSPITSGVSNNEDLVTACQNDDKVCRLV